jgi:hypothetical protein
MRSPGRQVEARNADQRRGWRDDPGQQGGDQSGGQRPEQRGGDPGRHQDQADRETEEGEQRRCRRQVAQADHRRRVGAHQAAVLQADEGDEEADPHGARQLDARRHCPHQDPPRARHGEQDKGRAAPEDHPQRGRPGDAGTQADPIGEEGVHPHARCERDRIVGQQGHQQGGEAGAQRGGDDRSLQRHSGGGQKHRIHRQDVGHGQERRETAEGLPAGRRPGGADVEEAFEHGGLS